VAWLCFFGCRSSNDMRIAPYPTRRRGAGIQPEPGPGRPPLPPPRLPCDVRLLRLGLLMNRPLLRFAQPEPSLAGVTTVIDAVVSEGSTCSRRIIINWRLFALASGPSIRLPSAHSKPLFSRVPGGASPFSRLPISRGSAFFPSPSARSIRITTRFQFLSSSRTGFLDACWRPGDWSSFR